MPPPPPPPLTIMDKISEIVKDCILVTCFFFLHENDILLSQTFSNQLKLPLPAFLKKIKITKAQKSLVQTHVCFKGHWKHTAER